MYACLAWSLPADPTTTRTGPAAAKIFNTLWALKKNDYCEGTLKTKGERLRHLAKHVNLDDPEAVKGYIASQSNWSNAYKQGVAYAYNNYVETNDACGRIYTPNLGTSLLDFLRVHINLNESVDSNTSCCSNC